MPIAMCITCHKPVPDSFHDFKDYCKCVSREDRIRQAKKNKWMLKIDGEVYDFTIIKKEVKTTCKKN